MKMRQYSSALVLTLSLFVANFALAEDWPRFRGPNHDGISPDTGFRKAWDEPIPLLWDHEVGSAFSSFAVAGGKLYTCGTANRQQVLYCLDAGSGKVIWETPIERTYRDNFGNGTRATPTVADGKVYVLGGHGKLLCVEADSGEEVWSKQFNHVPQWGYSGSVLIDGDLAISSAGNDEGSLVAFDKNTGRKRWQCGSDPAGYASPYPFEFEGTRYVVGFTGKSAIIAEIATGKLVWQEEWKTDWKVNAASPIFHDGHLFLTSGYKTGCALYKLSRSAGRLEGAQIWKSKVLMNKFQSCILHEGSLYASDQKAIVCADFLTGKEHWRVRRLENGSAKHGTLVLADGHLLLLTEDGKLKIAPADTKGFEPVTNAEILSGKCWTVPVLHNNRLYARNLERVAAFDLKP
jgi:outer membrane protein assembly factor BamB